VLLKRAGDLEIASFALDAAKSAALALAMAAALWPLYGGGAFPGAPKALAVGAGLILGPAIYFLLAHVTGSEGFGPLRETMAKLAGRLLRKRKNAAGDVAANAGDGYEKGGDDRETSGDGRERSRNERETSGDGKEKPAKLDGKA
jgi:hypothetical protein